MIYLFENPEQLNPMVYRDLLPLLSEQRREKINKFRFNTDRIQSVLAYILLRIGLFEEYGISDKVEFYEMNDKPSLKDHNSVHFNLSHCCSSVACAVSAKPVGIDVQNYEELSDLSIAYNFLSKEEITYVFKSGKPIDELTRLWTMKECYGKYTGEGILYHLNNTSFVKDNVIVGTLPLNEDITIESKFYDRFVLSVCGEESLSVCSISEAKLLEYILILR